MTVTFNNLLLKKKERKENIKRKIYYRYHDIFKFLQMKITGLFTSNFFQRLSHAFASGLKQKVKNSNKEGWGSYHLWVILYSLKITDCGSGETAQWLRALTLLPEDLRLKSQHPQLWLTPRSDTLTQTNMQAKYQLT